MFSARSKRALLPLPFPARLHAPKRRNDDIEQRPRPRPRQTRRPRLPILAMAHPERRPTHVRLGRPHREILPARQPARLLGLDALPLRLLGPGSLVRGPLAAGLRAPQVGRGGAYPLRGPVPVGGLGVAFSPLCGYGQGYVCASLLPGAVFCDSGHGLCG